MALQLAGWLFVALGAVFCVIGAAGMIRLPDVFTRMHAVGIVDTGGAGFILAGLAFQAGLTLVTVKLLLILVFIFFTAPTATHALARAALDGGQKPLLGDDLLEGGTPPSKT